MDPMTMLKTEHDQVKKLMAECEELEDGTEALRRREELFWKIHSALSVHEIVEEEIFYPALKEHPMAKDIVLEGIEEHDVVDHLMGELETLPIRDETWPAKFKVMRENVEHHIEEEEGTMFAKARQVFDRSELDRLGERMSARKAEAQEARQAASKG